MAPIIPILELLRIDYLFRLSFCLFPISRLGSAVHLRLTMVRSAHLGTTLNDHWTHIVCDIA